MKLYSESTGGFYLPEHGGPSDVVEISDERHAELLAAQGAGKQIVAGPNGEPIAQDRPPYVKTWGDIRQDAKNALDKTDVVALRCFKAGVPFTQPWKDYVTALRTLAGSSTGDPTQALPSAPSSYPPGS